MAAQKGSLLLLKADTAGGSPQSYATIAGLRTTTWTINGEDVDVTTKDDDGWRRRLAGAGVRSLSITAAGVFQDSAAEEVVRGWAFDQSINWFQITLENGDRIEGRFQLSNYERSGEFSGAEQYSLTLNSHGQVFYTAV